MQRGPSPAGCRACGGPPAARRSDARANASPRSSPFLLSVGSTITLARARTSSRDYTPDGHRSNPGTPTQPRRPDFIAVSDGRASPQRRFLSEGELVRAEPAGAAQRPTADDIRELAASPQRGNYLWAERHAHHAPCGGVPVFPPQPSPLPRRRPPPAPAPAPPSARAPRPLSFVRALEVQDALEARAPPPDPPDRASVYDCNYEISV